VVSFLPSSVVLVLLLAAAAPLLLRAAAPGGPRRLVAVVLGGLGLHYLGLYVLPWSAAGCVLLVALGLGAMLAATFPARALPAGLAGFAAGAAAGAVLLAGNPHLTRFALYVGFAAPALLGGALALALAPWLRRDGARAALVLAATILALAAFAPAAAYLLDFFASYELLQAPVMVGALAALALAARRMAALAAPAPAASVADALAGPAAQGSGRTAQLGIAAASCAALAVAAIFVVGGQAMVTLALASAALVVALAPVRRRELASVAAAGLALLAGLDIATSAGLLRHLGGGEPVTTTVVLLFGVGAAGVAVLALAVGVAAWQQRHARDALAARWAGVLAPAAEASRGLPPDALVEPGPLASVEALEAFAARLRREGRALGVLLVRAPADPLWTLPDASYAWLTSARAGPRVHVGVEDDGLVYFVPPVLSQEDVA
jgi:hypothetical protein